MSIPFNSQISININPTLNEHVVNLGFLNSKITDIYNFINNKVKSPVRVLIDQNIPSVYDDLVLISNYNNNIPTLFDNVALNINDRVLIIGQEDRSQNGIYIVSTIGDETPIEWVFTRADDYNSSEKIISGLSVQVNEGDDNQDTTWLLKTDGTIILDTTELEFIQAGNNLNFGDKIGKEVTFITNGISSSYIVNHNLNSMALVWRIREESTNESVMIDSIQLDENRLQLNFGTILHEGIVFIISILYAGSVGGNIPDSSIDFSGKIQLATEAEVFEGIDNTKAVTPAALKLLIDEIPVINIASESSAGKVQIATQTEVNAGINDIKVVTPLTLNTVISAIPIINDASTSSAGKIQIATQQEVIAGIDNTKAVTSASLNTIINSIPIIEDASTSAKGKVQIATQAEVTTGTDATKVVTPATLNTIVEIIEGEHEVLESAIAAVTGKLRYLPANDFGKSDIADDLTAYALAHTGLVSVYNGTAITNLYDNHEWIYSENDSEWIDNGLGTVSTATTIALGVAQLATQAEVITGTDANKIVTPATLAAKISAIPSVEDASTSSAGKVQLATQEEVTTGTDTTKAVTPASLKAAGVNDCYVSLSFVKGNNASLPATLQSFIPTEYNTYQLVSAPESDVAATISVVVKNSVGAATNVTLTTSAQTINAAHKGKLCTFTIANFNASATVVGVLLKLIP
jgi:hypothetical protein